MKCVYIIGLVRIFHFQGTQMAHNASTKVFSWAACLMQSLGPAAPFPPSSRYTQLLLIEEIWEIYLGFPKICY